MRLILKQCVPFPCEATWRLLTEPDLMNRWSTAKVHAALAGDGGGFDGVGAVRHVHLEFFHRTIQLEEVVQFAEPPNWFVYRIVGGVPLRDHSGEISIEPLGSGSHITWNVNASLSLPFLDQALANFLDRELRTSLRRLPALAPPEATRRTPSRFVERRPTSQLWAQAEAVLEAQRALAARLRERNDPKYWFAQIYEYVTREQLEACKASQVTHADWVLRLIVRFHDYYFDNFRSWTGERDGYTESHWRSAFLAMEEGSKWHSDPMQAIFHGLGKGVEAHIEEDLPRALAEVYVESYSDVCDYARFRADYLLMGHIFARAAGRFRPHVPREIYPILLRALDPVLPREAREVLSARYFYNVPRERRRAFERGERLARMLVRARQRE